MYRALRTLDGNSQCLMGVGVGELRSRGAATSCPVACKTRMDGSARNKPCKNFTVRKREACAGKLTPDGSGWVIRPIAYESREVYSQRRGTQPTISLRAAQTRHERTASARQATADALLTPP